jgi:eukaryotic-like serine/threonine-protein kinase
LAKKELIVLRGASRFRDEVEFEFKNELVRDAADAMLTESDRALGRRLARAWLEAREDIDEALLAALSELDPPG